MGSLEKIGLVTGAFFFAIIIVWRMVSAVKLGPKWVERAVGRTDSRS
jgi:hypothetical protein